MTVDELERLYRSRFDDINAKKYALSPSDFLMYINEAQDQACLRADLIFDKTSSFCTKAIAIGTRTVTLDDSIYGIKYARLIDASGTSTRIYQTTDEELDAQSTIWRDDTGLPTRFLHYHTTLEFDQAPEEAYTLKMEVYRLGEKMTSNKSEPEISRQWHTHLVEWPIYRMYSMPDEDYHQPEKAVRAYNEFERIFGPLPTARDYADKFQDLPHHNKASFP